MNASLDKWKEKGKLAFASKKYRKAIEYYTRAIQELDKRKRVGGVEAAKALDLSEINFEMALFHSNRSACYDAIHDYSKALADANEALQCRPYWAKAYYRKGNAELGLALYDEASVSFGKSFALNESSDSRKSIEEKLYDAVLLNEEAVHQLYFKALLPGRDICLRSYSPMNQLVFTAAKAMNNIVYLVGDRQSRECIVVDACWDIDAILGMIKRDGMKLAGAVVTHYHFDHVGGKPPPPYHRYGVQVPGLRKLLEKIPSMPVYVGPGDVEFLVSEADIPRERIRSTVDGQVLRLGSRTDALVQFIHTPGHTAGSQCLSLLNGRRVLTGDTLFIGKTGRTDLPGGDIRQLYESLQTKLAVLNEQTFIFPGHAYGGLRTTVKREKEAGFLKPMTMEAFLFKIRQSQCC